MFFKVIMCALFVGALGCAVAGKGFPSLILLLLLLVWFFQRHVRIARLAYELRAACGHKSIWLTAKDAQTRIGLHRSKQDWYVGSTGGFTRTPEQREPSLTLTVAALWRLVGSNKARVRRNGSSSHQFYFL